MYFYWVPLLNSIWYFFVSLSKWQLTISCVISLPLAINRWVGCSSIFSMISNIQIIYWHRFECGYKFSPAYLIIAATSPKRNSKCILCILNWRIQIAIPHLHPFRYKLLHAAKTTPIQEYLFDFVFYETEVIHEVVSIMCKITFWFHRYQAA